MSNKLEFPEGFYWGAATASYQVEGGIYNCDWAKAAERGKVPKAGESSDHYNRYEEDFDIAESLGHNASRISIEWARIEPEEGKFDEEEVEHYRSVLKAMKARGLEPFVTLWHFTLPLWFSERGGFLRKDSPEIFARYCEYVTGKLKNECSHWATINEPVVYASNGWIRGIWPPFKHAKLFTFLKVTNILAKAHNLAYERIKKVTLSSEVGIVKDNIYFHANRNPWNKIRAAFMNWFWNRHFLNKMFMHCDTIGLNYYFHSKFGDTAEYEKTDMGWDIFPEGIYHTLKELSWYGLPVFIAEAGIADAKDDRRAMYIKDELRYVHKAIEDGVDVRGFLYWSLLDNFEWAQGYDKRFGLVEIDYETKGRKVRDSAYEYKKICEANALVT